MTFVEPAPKLPCRWKYDGGEYSQDCDFYQFAVLLVELKEGRITDLQVNNGSWTDADYNTQPEEYNVWSNTVKKLL